MPPLDAATGKGVAFCYPLAMVNDRLARILVAEQNRALGSREEGLAVNQHDVDGAELLAVELLHLIFCGGFGRSQGREEKPNEAPPPRLM